MDTNGLNVPYESGFAFVRDPVVHAGAFSATAAYLRTDTTDGPCLATCRLRFRAARALYRSGRRCARTAAMDYREMVERHLRLAQRVAGQVDEAPDLERLAEVPLNVICFRFRPPAWLKTRWMRSTESSVRWCSTMVVSISARPTTRARRIPACDRQLAHNREGRRPHREGRP